MINKINLLHYLNNKHISIEFSIIIKLPHHGRPFLRRQLYVHQIPFLPILAPDHTKKDIRSFIVLKRTREVI